MKPTGLTNKFAPFTYKSFSELEETVKKLNLDIPILRKTEILKMPVNSKEIYFPNRLAINPMEGFDADLDGQPGKLTFRRYVRYARGGAGLIWFEATAISETCRSNEHQLMITEKNIGQFKELTTQTREIANQTLRELGFENECILILQLNHSGRYSQRGGKRFPIRAYHNVELDEAIHVSRDDGVVISDEELREIENLWIEKAILAREAGFDGVDIKSCHGYLISELLSARARENSDYGGKQLENRSAFLLNIIKNLKNSIRDSDFLLTTRLGVYDGVPYPNGFGNKVVENDTFPALIDLTEPIELIKQLHKLGVRLINISAGNPHYKPYITRPYNQPVKGSQLPSEHPLYGVGRIIHLTSMIRRGIPQDTILMGSCYSYLREYAGNIAAGLINGNVVDVCGFGRMAFANPDFPRQIFQEGKIDKKKTCITCSKCTELMKLGKATGCVLRDPEYHQ